MSYSIVSNVVCEDRGDSLLVSFRYTESNTFSNSPTREFSEHSYEENMVYEHDVDNEIDSFLESVKIPYFVTDEAIQSFIYNVKNQGYAELVRNDDRVKFEREIYSAKIENHELLNYVR